MPHKHKQKHAPKPKKKGVTAVVVKGAGSYHVSRVPKGPRVHGKGGYFTDWLGDGIKHGASWLGDKISSWIKGSGDYQIRKNTLLTTNATPTFKRGREGSVRVSHCEYFGDVAPTSQNFQVVLGQSSINPTNGALFPWLSSIATQFEEFRFHGLLVHYKPTSGMAVSSTNPSLGGVVMSTQYNPYDSVFPTKLAMEAYQYSTSCPPFEPMLHPIECDPRDNPISVLFTSSNNTSDLRFVEQGALSVATFGLPSSSEVCGELWVTYDVELIKPRLPTVGSNVVGAHFAFPANGAGNLALNAMQPTSQAGSNTTTLSNDTGVVMSYSAAIGGGGDHGMILTNFQIPGDYMVVATSFDTTNSTHILGGWSLNNVTGVGEFYGASETQRNNSQVVAQGSAMICQVASFSVSNAQIVGGQASVQAKFVSAGNSGDVVSCDVLVFFTGGSLLKPKPLDRRGYQQQLADLRSELFARQEALSNAPVCLTIGKVGSSTTTSTGPPPSEASADVSDDECKRGWVMAPKSVSSFVQPIPSSLPRRH